MAVTIPAGRRPGVLSVNLPKLLILITLGRTIGRGREWKGVEMASDERYSVVMKVGRL